MSYIDKSSQPAWALSKLLVKNTDEKRFITTEVQTSGSWLAYQGILSPPHPNYNDFPSQQPLKEGHLLS